MTNPEDKCPLCGEQMLSLACPGGCFTATAHEVDGLVCKDRQRTREVRKARKARKESAAGTIRAVNAEAYRVMVEGIENVLCGGEPEAEKPHGPTCVELTTAFRDIQRLLTEYLVPDGCNAHETITKILAITDTKPFSQLRRETHDETRI